MATIDLGKVVGADGKDGKGGGFARNLLDNSDFTNPVNQRGQATYTGTYGIDRWRCWDSDTITVNNGYVSVAGSMFQHTELSNVKNTNYTLAVCHTDGNIVCLTHNPKNTYIWNAGIGLGSNGTGVVNISIDTGDYLWACLYEGEYTVETLPPYVPKGYAAELAECQRYFLTDVGAHTVGHAGVMPNKEFYINISTPSAMRITPTATIDTADNVIFGTTSGYAICNVTGIKSVGKKSNGIFLILDLGSEPPQHYATGSTFGTSLTLSADL